MSQQQCVLLVLMAVVVMVVCGKYHKVPGGRMEHESCLHRVPEGSVIRETADGRLFIDADEVPRCKSPAFNHGPAWKAWTEYNCDHCNITSFVSDWVVPPNPTKHYGQIVYLWNGMEPTDNSAVIQPVLQWGSTPAGGGDYWAVASWYVSSKHGTLYSDVVKCQPGDSIHGVMQQLPGGNWTITATVSSTKQSAVLSLIPADFNKYTWVYEVLEYYGSACSGYPSNACVFNNIEMFLSDDKTLTQIPWVAQTKSCSCGEHAVIASSDEVTIYFK